MESSNVMSVPRMFSSMSSAQVKRFSVITWNVWFDDFKKNERYDEILAICQAASPDIICLQEVTPSFVKKIKEHGLAECYHISDPELDGSSVGSYGVLTMCRRQLNAVFEWHELPTDMGRKLLTTTFSSHAGSLSVGNVHLESLNSAAVRFAQLKVCSRILDRTALSVLCGDFNFDSDKNFRNDGRPLENDVLGAVMPSYKDVWLELHPPTTGKTYDTEVNLMLPRKEERMRYDRILLRSAPVQLVSRVFKALTSSESARPQDLVPTEIRLLGTAPLGYNLPLLGNGDSLCVSTPVAEQIGVPSPPVPAPSLPDAFVTPEKKPRPIFPSDHFGLHAVFAFNV